MKLDDVVPMEVVNADDDIRAYTRLKTAGTASAAQLHRLEEACRICADYYGASSPMRSSVPRQMRRSWDGKDDVTTLDFYGNYAVQLTLLVSIISLICIALLAVHTVTEH